MTTEDKKVLSAKQYKNDIYSMSKINVGDYLVQGRSVYKITQIFTRDFAFIDLRLIGNSLNSSYIDFRLMPSDSLKIVYKKSVILKNHSIYKEMK